MSSLEESDASAKESMHRVDCEMLGAEEPREDSPQLHNGIGNKQSHDGLTSHCKDFEMICEIKDLTESEFKEPRPGSDLADPTDPSAKERNEKYYKKFDFFYRRTAFRSMTEFYKGLFKPNLDKWREGERKSTKNFVLNYLWKKSELEYRGSSDQNDIKKLQILVN
jgi:hypothetical protein